MKTGPATYVISIPDGGTWALIEVHGSVTTETIKSIVNEATQLAKEHSLLDFLYDGTDSSSSISILDQYQVVNRDLSMLGFDRRAKIAMLIRAEDTSRDFIETALRNAGYNCRLFTEREEAKRWLSQSE